MTEAEIAKLQAPGDDDRGLAAEEEQDSPTSRPSGAAAAKGGLIWFRVSSFVRVPEVEGEWRAPIGKRLSKDTQGLISDFASQKCPYCGKRLKVVSRVVGGWTRYAVCHHCGQDAEKHTRVLLLGTRPCCAARHPHQSQRSRRAPRAGESVRASAYSCSGCGAVLPCGMSSALSS